MRTKEDLSTKIYDYYDMPYQFFRSLCLVEETHYIRFQNMNKAEISNPFTHAFSSLKFIFKELTLFVASKVSASKMQMQYGETHG